MWKYGWKTALALFLLFLLPFFNPTAEGGTGSIRAKIVLPGDTGAAGAAIPLSIRIQPMGIGPLEGGDGGGGDGGGGDGGDGGGGGDGGYWIDPYAPIASVKILEDRILNLENLNEGLKNLIIKYEKEMRDQFGNLILDEFGNVKKEEFDLALKNIRVVEGQVTDLKNLLLKKGGTITGSIKYAGRNDFPTATVHVVGFAGTSISVLPPWFNDRTITATDQAGNFMLTNLPEGTYTLAITPGGDAAATHAREIITNVRVVSGQLSPTSATPFGPFELTSTMGALSGRVRLLDRLSGPYDGTLVRATSTDGRFRSYIQATDANGYYDFGQIPIGSYHLYIQHSGYAVSEGDITLTSAGLVPPPTWLESGTKKICGNVGLPDGGQRGDVNNDKKIGIADAVLALQTTTHLNAIAPSLWGEVNGDGKIGLAEAVYALQVASELRMPSGSALSGTLVMIPGTSLMAATDAAGNFTIEKIPEKAPGNWTYDLFISRNGYQALRQEGVLAQDTCNYSSLSLTLPPHETVIVEGKVVPKGSIMGRAWLKKSTDDYRGIDVAIENTGFVTKPNISGNFIFTDVPPGSYTLNYTNAGYKTVAEAGVLVAPDLTTETRNIVLIPRNGTIKGQVRLEGSSTCGGINIRVEPSEAQISVSPTDASCNFSISVPENFNVLTNAKCVLNNATGACTSSPSYTVVAGDKALEELGYITHPFPDVNVPAGETVDLGVIEIKKPPAPPSGVAAVQKDGSSITVSWTASSSTDVAGYNVYYGTRSDQIDQKANDNLIATQSGGKWQFTVTGIEKGIPYFFAVQAVDGDSLAGKTAPADGSCTWTLVPDGAKISQLITSGINFSNGSLTDIALVGDGSKSYVSDGIRTNVYLVDFNAVLPTPHADATNQISLGTGAQPVALAYNPFRNELYVVNAAGAGSLRIIDPLTNTLQTIIIPTGAFPRNVIISPDGAMIYVCNKYSDSGQSRVTVIDAATSSVTATIPLGDIDPYGMTIARNKLYVADTAQGWIYVIDLDSASPNYRTVIKSVNAGVGAYDAIARPDGAFVYVSLNRQPNSSVAVIDTAADQLMGNPIPVGNNPMGMAVSGNILYVTNYWDPSNQISMINTVTNTKLETGAIASGGTNPKALAVSPDGNKLYVVHEGSVTIVSY
jgi:YVTN family beta-propeller protein